jgi:GNAT superfamily N-acetyltransferase
LDDEDFLMIRSAKQKEADHLTSVSFASKAYWRYPEQYFKTWQNELTITPEYIDENDVFVIENNGVIVGYYAIVELKKKIEVSGILIDKGFWLDHMFVVPEYIGCGFGRLLFDHLQARCKTKGIESIKILADPHSRRFYEKLGCLYIKEIPSTIAGRTTPLLTFSL